MQIDRLPPQELRAERAVIGALLIDKSAHLEVQSLTPEMFYLDKHLHIFQAIKNVALSGQAVDTLTVFKELKKNSRIEEVGGPAYLGELANEVSVADHVGSHARLIQDAWALRATIDVNTRIQRTCHASDADAQNILAVAQRDLLAIQSSYTTGKEVQHISQVVQLEELDFINRSKAKKNNEVIGIPSGLIDLDHFTSGWQEPDLIIIGARPAMGKTSLARGIARAAAEHGDRGAVFTLEMSALQIVKAMLIADSQISGIKYKNADLGNGEISALFDARRRLETQGLYIDDTAAITLYEMRTKLTRLKQLHGIKWAIVDYLQLMRNPEFKNNREQEISSISRGLKAICKDLNIHIIALSQLSRALEKRGGENRPQLSDLRESGAIEQDADIVIFIHRPEYYGITQDAEGNSTHGIAELIIAKHRNGSVGTIEVKWLEKHARFMNMGGEPIVMQAALETNKDFFTDHQEDQF